MRGALDGDGVGVSRTCLGRAGSCLGFRGRVFFCFVGFLGVLFSFLSIGWLVREGRGFLGLHCAGRGLLWAF